MSHFYEEHTSEVRVRVEAPTLAALFEESAAVLCELTAGADFGPAERVESVTLASHDREALLVDWLNELVYRSESRKLVYPFARVERVDDRSLAATLRGAEPRVIHTPVKAATMHDVEVAERDGAWTARFVLDV